MIKQTSSLLALALAVSCASTPPPAEPAPAAEPMAAEPAAPAPPPPSPEEQKAAADKAKLEADRAKLKADHEAAKARFTPEVTAAAKKASEASYASGKAAIMAATKGPWRSTDNMSRDSQRHPVETLDFFGFKPTMTVVEVGPGGGWWTELLAPALAKKGKLIVTNGDRTGPVDQRGTYYAERVALMLETSPELFGKVETKVVDGKAPVLGMDKNVDMVFVARGLHGMVNAGTLDAWLAQWHAALKDKGVLAIEQHRAKEGADVTASSKQGYLPQAWVVSTIEAAGFKLEKASEINANPKDTKDYKEGVWALPPSLERGETDKAAMMAIGESDRMTLKFVKVKKPATPAAAASSGVVPAPAAAVVPAPAAAVVPAPAATTTPAPAATPAPKK